MSLNQRQLWLPLLLLSLSVCSFALRADGAADLKKRVVVDSNTQELNLKTNEVLFVGNVVITQGSIRILADRLKVLRTADGSGVERMIAYGTPASYFQRLEDGTPVKAEGNMLEYRTREQTLIIEGNAQISQENNLIKGKRIRYNLAKEQLFAESDDKNTEDRVTTIFLPPAETDN